MYVWDVLGKRSPDDQFTVVGGVKAPDLQMALLLARESYFRRKEGVAYAVRLRGDGTIHEGPYDKDVLGGLTDRSYRRQEGYVGVGAKLKRVRDALAARGAVIDRPRPPSRRPPAAASPNPRGRGEPPSIRDVPPEDLAAQGTAG